LKHHANLVQTHQCVDNKSTQGDDVVTTGEENAVDDNGALLLRYQAEPNADATIMHVTGDIDLETSDTFADGMSHALGGGGGSVVVVDLRHVTFMGSIGLSALTRANDTAARNRRQLRIVVGAAAAHRAIEISGLDQVLSVFGTVDDAIAG
jgi:anti-sigma B factor antagonist